MHHIDLAVVFEDIRCCSELQHAVNDKFAVTSQLIPSALERHDFQLLFLIHTYAHVLYLYYTL